MFMKLLWILKLRTHDIYICFSFMFHIVSAHSTPKEECKDKYCWMYHLGTSSEYSFFVTFDFNCDAIYLLVMPFFQNSSNTS